jgi:hypothetical protein
VLSPVSVTVKSEHTAAKSNNDKFSLFSDDKDNSQPQRQVRRSKRAIQKMRNNEKYGLHRIAALAAKEPADVPDLAVKTNKLAHGMVSANLNLQLNKRGYKASESVGAVIDEKTGKHMEYCNLIKNPELCLLWTRALANKLGRMTQGTHIVIKTNTMFFITKSQIPSDKHKNITYGRTVVRYKPDKLEKTKIKIDIQRQQTHSMDGYGNTDRKSADNQNALELCVVHTCSEVF